MKRLPLILVLVLLALLLSSCAEKVTPVAYTRFDATGTQYVYNSSSKLQVYADEDTFKADYSTPDLDFLFGRCLGSDVLGGKRYTLVDLSGKAVWMTVYIKSEVYSASKHIYLNGIALTPDATDNSGVLVTLEFDDVDFIRTNKYGSIDSSAVNVLEYR